MLFVLALLVHSLLSVNAACILGIFPTPARSHFSCNYAILKSLHSAGHHVTMLSPFPPDKNMDNFTHINMPFDGTDFNEWSTIDRWTGMTLSELMNTLALWNTQLCQEVMELPQIQEILRTSSEKRYDVFFAEFLTDLYCYLPIARKLDIPVIVTMTTRNSRKADQAIGIPNNPAIVPAEFQSSSVEMSFLERIKNVWNALIMDFYIKQCREDHYEISRKYAYFSEDLLNKEDISLVFYNSHTSLLSRADVPAAVDVGGIVVGPAKPLPRDIQEFIDEAPRGVILFTLGSMVRANTMSKAQKEAFLAAFASIPQRVIWKFEEPIENLPKNVMLRDWLPQRDILEHANVIAFMSHCGLSGVFEAVMTGTPVVTIPFFADQRPNAALLHYRGVGVDLDLKTATKETILTALNTIINDTSYYERMQTLSRVFKDRPMSPQEAVVYWTEYVIRYNGAPHLKALGTDMPFYQYFMLDIIGLVITVLCIGGFVISFVLKKVFIMLTKSSKYTSQIKKDT